MSPRALTSALALAAGLAPGLMSLPGCSSSSSGAQDGGATADGSMTDGPAVDGEGSDAAPTDDASDGAVRDDFAWVDSFSAGFGSSIMAMATDGSSVVIVGQVVGTATLGTTTLTAASSTGNAFVAKLDGTGKVVWARVASGSSSDFEAVAIDASGNVVVSGTDFGDAPSFTFAGTTLTPNQSATIGGNPVGASAGVLTELDPTGTLEWAKMMESTGEVNVGSLAISGRTVYAAGPIIDDASFAPSEGMPITGCGTAGCVYLAAWAGDGTVQWAKQAASTPHRGTGVDPREVWLAANATNLFLAIGGDLASASGSSDAGQIVVNQYDLTGALGWSKVAPLPNGGPSVSGLAVDATGEAFVSGSFADGLVLGTLTVAGGDYVAKYSASGAIAWAVDNPSTGALGVHGLALGASLYSFGNGVLGGELDGGTSMSLDGYDPATGKISSADPCSAAMGIGQTVAASGTAVFVAGAGGPTGQFGTHDLSASGLFVGRKK